MRLDLRSSAQQRQPSLAGEPALADPALRRAALATWHGRMVNEYGSAQVFEALAQQLAAAEVDASQVSACRKFADEERQHGVLCGAVVEALGGEACADVAEPLPVPAHADAASALEAALRNLLSICCLSETVAVALIGAERLEMPEGPLRELLTRIYSDEVGHANFGWRLLPQLLGEDAALRERLADYLRVAFGHLEHHELAHLPLNGAPPALGARLGVCSGADARALFYDCITQVIVPALEQHGIAASTAWQHRRSGQPT